MEENKENVVEETTQQNQQDPTKENIVKVDLNNPPKPEEEKNENVVEETTQDNVTKVKVEEPKKEDNVTKVNLDKPPKPKENEVKEDNVNDSGVATKPENAEPAQEQEEVQPEPETQQSPTLEEITEESTEEEVV